MNKPYRVQLSKKHIYSILRDENLTLQVLEKNYQSLPALSSPCTSCLKFGRSSGITVITEYILYAFRLYPLITLLSF